MKVVINKCFGGFGLSPAATLRYWELKGRPCFLFVRPMGEPLDGALRQVTPEEAADALMFHVYDVPNPNEVLPSQENWFAMTMDERRASNEVHESHDCSLRDVDRDDPVLVRVVEEMGDRASGKFGELAVVEIPDGVEWEIKEYDGREHIAEAHRTWA